MSVTFYTVIRFGQRSPIPDLSFSSVFVLFKAFKTDRTNKQTNDLTNLIKFLTCFNSFISINPFLSLGGGQSNGFLSGAKNHSIQSVKSEQKIDEITSWIYFEAFLPFVKNFESFPQIRFLIRFISLGLHHSEKFVEVCSSRSRKWS